MYLLEIILLSYFTYVSLYSFILSIGGLLYKNKVAPPATYKRKVAVLIPAYKEDGVIVSVAQNALEQSYPHLRYEVVIIADSLQQSTLERLYELPITVVKVSFDKSTKVKALNKAMEVIGDDYDCALVLDADNVMEYTCIEKMNNMFELGYKALQVKRDPKNDNTSMAVLDGLSETINNFIYRQGTVGLGMSASLNGSGMIFDYKIYKEILSKMDSIGGFDRELELKLIERGIKTHFAGNIVVYDEKVSNPEVFEKQRKRWISSQFFYLKKYFVKGFVGLLKGNFSFFNSAVLRNIQLPRLLNLGLLSCITLTSLVLYKYVNINPLIWVGLLTLNALSILFAIPRNFYSAKSLKSVMLVPGIFLKMFLLLFKLRGANKTFIHTPHGHVETTTTAKPKKVEKV